MQPNSDMEWYIEQAHDPNSERFMVVFMRLRAIYRVGYGRMTQEATDLLGKMAAFLCDCEREAEEKGLEWLPLSKVELEAAFPFRDEEINAVGYGHEVESGQKTNWGLGRPCAAKRKARCGFGSKT